MRINELIVERDKAMLMEAVASRKHNDDSEDSAADGVTTGMGAAYRQAKHRVTLSLPDRKKPA